MPWRAGGYPAGVTDLVLGPLLRYVSETEATIWVEADGPFHFDKQVATLRLEGRRASVRLDKTVAGKQHERRLEKSFERRLA